MTLQSSISLQWEATAPGFATMVSSDVVDLPIASSVNFWRGSIDPNVAFAKIGADGTVCVVNSELGSVDLVADQLMTIAGSFSGTGVSPRFDTALTAARLIGMHDCFVCGNHCRWVGRSIGCADGAMDTSTLRWFGDSIQRRDMQRCLVLFR